LPLSPSLFPANCFVLVPSHFACCFAPMFTFRLVISPFVLLPHPCLYCFALVLHAYSIAFRLLFLPFNLLPHLSNCYLTFQLIVPHLCFALCCFVLHFTLCHLTLHPTTSYVTLLLHIFLSTFYYSLPLLLSYLLFCVSFLVFPTYSLMKYLKLIMPKFYHVIALGRALSL
jgi:hypothetical protein